MIFLLSLALAQAAHAYPEMVRHHYVNCNACHVNPSGGGLLSEYGRGMSGEVLSTWHYENESLFLHGALKPSKLPKLLNVGGDLRALQVHRETKTVREGRYILMQSMLEAGVTVGPLTAVAAFGAPDAQNHIHGEFTRFYLLGAASDTIQIKAGRFLPAFGIAEPHHILSPRQGLGFGFGSERNSLEAHYSGEQWHFAAGASESRPESQLRLREKAGLVQAEKFFSDSYRVGVSLWRGSADSFDRTLASLHAILGFTEHLYATTETAWQFRKAKAAGAASVETGLYHFTRAGYELTQGLHLTALEDISQTNVALPNTLSVLAGGGPVWYPRPHFEAELVFAQRRVLKTSQDWEDYAYLMFHYYL